MLLVQETGVHRVVRLHNCFLSIGRGWDPEDDNAFFLYTGRLLGNCFREIAVLGRSQPVIVVLWRLGREGRNTVGGICIRVFS